MTLREKQFQAARTLIQKGFAYRTIQKETGLRYWEVSKLAMEEGGVRAYREGRNDLGRETLNRITRMLEQIKEIKYR